MKIINYTFNEMIITTTIDSIISELLGAVGVDCVVSHIKEGKCSIEIQISVECDDDSILLMGTIIGYLEATK